MRLGINLKGCGIAVLLTAISLAGCAREPENPYPAGSNILLLTVDTLRADHLSSYGYPRRTSPVLDRLASEGVRFEQPAVQWPKTGPSFASIFTSTYPKDNGIVRRVGMPLPHEFLMLAEMLQRHGYTTHAVVANGAVASDFNFNQGFDTYVETWKQELDGFEGDPNGAEAVNLHVRRILDDMDDTKPFFLWVHYLDPHFPYVPPAEWADHFQDDEWFEPIRTIEIDQEKAKQQVTGIGHGQVLDGRDDLGFYIARYDAEIAYTDFQIGELFEDLHGQGLLDNTLTVFTSDHGESLGDHAYYFDHGRFSFQTCLRVPLVLHYPGVLPPRVDREPVELINLAPTILEAAGVELEEQSWMQGRSLTGRMLGWGPDGNEPVYARSEAGYATKGRWQKIARDERYKLIFAPFRGDQRWIGGAPEIEYALFDLHQDPGETENLVDERPEEFARLKDELYRWWRPNQFDVLVDPAGSGAEGEMSEETSEQLKALGYLE
jgi:arylsulfatase A-like enzyme